MAQKWLDAKNTEKEAEVTKAYIQELSEDVLSIDAFIQCVVKPLALAMGI